jgi:hypothetical protein
MRQSAVALLLAILSLTGCSRDEPEHLWFVTVMPGGQRCSIEKQEMPCGQVAEHLAAALRVGRADAILVTGVGRYGPEVYGFADELKRAGFDDVEVVGFETD